MGENRNEILSALRDAVSSIRVQLDAIEAQIAELERVEPVVDGVLAADATPDVGDLPEDAAEMDSPVAAEEPAYEEPAAAEPDAAGEQSEEVEAAVADAPVEESAEPAGMEDPIDLDIDADLPEVTFAQPAAAASEPVAAASEPVASEPVAAEPASTVVETGVLVEEPSVLAAAEPRPVVSINDAGSRNIRKAVKDVVEQKEAWRTAIPGTPVKNIISAISLNDRVLFINTLFGEDPMRFQNTLSELNAMSSLAQAEEYITANFHDWKMESDVVYRFMMAVRRKLK